MTPWWQGRLVGFDLETTGVDVEQDRIVTAGMCHVGGGLEPVTLELLADPGVEIPEGATAVHGISTEQARADGLPAEQVVGAVVEELTMAASQGWAVVAFRAPFDLTMLACECRRYGITFPESMLVVDPSVIDKHLDPFRKGSRSLGAVCGVHGVELPDEDAHTASADALAACRLAWVLGAHGEVKRGVRNAQEGYRLKALRDHWGSTVEDLSTLHWAQKAWAATQAESLRAYFERKGDMEAAASVSEHWPLVPYPEAA